MNLDWLPSKFQLLRLAEGDTYVTFCLFECLVKESLLLISMLIC